MTFNTPKERDETFGELERDPSTIPYGAAFDHAAIVDLGVLGNDADIRNDCARLMLYEIRRWLLTHPKPQLANVTPSEIARSKVFNTAYTLVRMEPEVRLGISSAEESEILAETLDPVSIQSAIEQKVVHRHIVEELLKHRPSLPRRRRLTDW